MALAEKIKTSRARGRQPPSEFDLRFGRLLRSKRRQARLSMENVADACGIVFQGVQRYETGINSVNVERFLELAIAIGFSPTEFLNEIVDSNSFEVVNVPDLDLDDINILEAFRRVPPEDKKILLSLAKHFAEKAETNR